MAPRPPNLLFVFADQMRGMAMGCAGNPDVRTPHLDRLAREGTRFTAAYANCPVCTPSRAVLLTGRHAIATGVVANDLPLPPAMPSIGDVLAAAGYRTAYIGKWHLDGVPRSRFTPPGPRRHGFQFWAAYNCSHDYMHARYYRDAPEPIAIEGYEPAGQTDILLDFLRAPDPRPFAAFLSWGPPHDPYDRVPREYLEPYLTAPPTARPNVRPVPGDTVDLLRGADPAKTLAAYYAQISALDAQLGRILDTLAERGPAGDTLLVFTSDHGDMLWSQGRLMKQQPWEESISVPLLMRWPGRVPAGREARGLIGLCDLAPTLLGLLGLPAPAEADGADLSAMARGEAVAGVDSVYIYDLVSVDQSQRQGLPEWRGVRTPRYTYARTFDGPWLLYDNDRDPYQLENLAGRAEAAGVRARLEGAVQRWLEATSDPFVPGSELIRRLGLGALWNARERELHPRAPRLVAEEGSSGAPRA